MIRYMIVVSAFLIACASSPGTDDVEVGFGKADITPDLAEHAVWISGYGNNRRATGVHDKLWARAVVLREGASKLALVSVDLIGLQRPDVIKVRERLPRYLPEKNITNGFTSTKKVFMAFQEKNRSI